VRARRLIEGLEAGGGRASAKVARMRILFVACYFPPANSTGARRVTAFARNLAARGHDVVVITPTKRPAHGPLTEPIPPGVRVLELPRPTQVTAEEAGEGAIARRASMRDRVRRRVVRVVLRLCGQLVDRELVFVKDLLRDPRAQAEARQADVLVSTSPPWVTHLGAWLLARRWHKPWLSDYRDQFSNSQFVEGSRLSRRAELVLDRWLVRHSKATTTVSRAMQEYYAQWQPDAHLIYNGFEPSGVRDALVWAGEQQPRRDEFVVRYVGTYVEALPPHEFLQALQLLARDVPVRFEVVGDNAEALQDHLRTSFPDLVGVVDCRPKVGGAEALRLMAGADCLVVLETWQRSVESQRGVATTKLFEYLAVRRPVIIAASPGIEAARIARDAGLLVCASTSSDELYRGLQVVASGGFEARPVDEVIAGFSREGQAVELESVLQDLIAAGGSDEGGQ
jgi:glycosyltransferase involved in cell wall biosynthesis